MRIGRLMLAALALALGAAPARAQDAALTPTIETYAKHGDRSLSAHIYRTPASKAPASAVLLFPGGAWEYGRPEWMSWHAEQFARRGMVAISIEYRLIDMKAPRAQRTTIVDATADACAAFAWARANAARLGIDPNRIAGFGISAGGHLAAMAGSGGCGAEGRADLLILNSPALDTRSQGYYAPKMPEGADAAMLGFYSPTDRLRDGAALVPTLIVNGSEDIQTPAASATEFCALAVARGTLCRVELYPGLGHLLTADLAAQQRGQYPPNFPATARAQTLMEAFLAERGF